MFKKLIGSPTPQKSWRRPERPISRFIGRFTFVILAITLALTASSVMAQTTVSQFFQGFEVDGIWTASPLNTVTRVPSGTNGVTSRTGGFHGHVGTNSTRWGGYNSVFPAHGYVTTVSIYLNVGGGYANDTRFDWDSAINDSSGNFRRDFIFNAGFYNSGDVTGPDPGINRFIVSSSFNSQPGSAFAKNPANGPIAISTSGWYTFRHRFYNNAGVLAVEMTIRDSSNALVGTWILSNPADTIATTGGNRYGWFDYNQFGGLLAIDDSERANVIETLYVDDDGTADSSGCNTGSAFTTITAAIAASGPGDTISVCPGIYNENPAINKSLTVQSTGGRDVTTIQLPPSPNGYPYGGMYLSGAGNNITLDGFEIRGVDGTPTVSATTNILMGGSPNSVVIKNNRILVAKLGYAIPSDFDHGQGFATDYNSGPVSLLVENNIIDMVSNTGPAWRPYYVNPSPYANTFTFKDNSVTGEFSRTAATQAGDSFIDNNTATGTGGTWGFGVGNGGGPMIYNQATFTKNYFSGLTRGILISNTSNVTVTGNTLSGNTNGVEITGTSPTNINLSFNRIVGNTTAGVNSTATASVNAINNWWGCNYGPGSAGPGCPIATNGVLGAMSVNPWLVMNTAPTAPSTTTGGPGMTVYSNLWKDSNGATPVGGFVRDGTPDLFATDFGSVGTPNAVTVSGQAGTFVSSANPGLANVTSTIDGQTQTTQVYFYTNACALISIPTAIPTLRNQPVTVPISSDLLTGRNALGFDTTISYDSTKLTFISLSSAGTLTSGLSYTVNEPTPGTLEIFAFGDTPLAGSGVLFNLSFQAIGTVGGPPTPVTLTGFEFNEGNPCSIETSGSVQIISGDISGRVTFALNGAHGVPNVAMNATGTSPAVTTNTDYTVGTPATWGNYTLNGFGSGPYTVMPAKAPQPAQSGPTINGIGPSDSSCIALWGTSQNCTTNAGSTSVPSPGSARFRAADVTKNGTLSPLDAAYIAQFSVNIPNPGFAGTWEFIAPSTNYTQAQVETGMSGQNYTAILLGDVTGNWNPAVAGGNRPATVDPELQKDAALVSAAELQAAPGGTVTVPVSIRNLADRSVTAYQFDVIYDPRVLEPMETSAGLAGTVSDGMSVVFNRAEPGRLKVAVYGATQVTGDGTLVDLHFRAIGAVGTASTLSIEPMVLNEGNIAVLTRDGQVSVSAAEHGTIRGRLLTASGQGIVNARVDLTSTTGEKRSVLSSSFGAFEFGGLTTGETYTITVNSKRYTFSPRTISISDAVTVLDMIAEQ